MVVLRSNMLHLLVSDVLIEESDRRSGHLVTAAMRCGGSFVVLPEGGAENDDLGAPEDPRENPGILA